MMAVAERHSPMARNAALPKVADLMTPARVVVDANVVVSAILNPAGAPRRALDLARIRDTIVLSPAVFDELIQVLGRPKFARSIPPEFVQEILISMRATASWFEPALTVVDCADQSDNRYLELAFAAQASIIVSGDADLLTLDAWRGIRILRPAEYVRLRDRATLG